MGDGKWIARAESSCRGERSDAKRERSMTYVGQQMERNEKKKSNKSKRASTCLEQRKRTVAAAA